MSMIYGQRLLKGGGGIFYHTRTPRNLRIVRAQNSTYEIIKRADEIRDDIERTNAMPRNDSERMLRLEWMRESWDDLKNAVGTLGEAIGELERAGELNESENQQ